MAASDAGAHGGTGPAGLDQVRREVALANHVLYDQGVLDGFGHVSARHPVRPDRFLLSRNLAPALVTPADVLEFDLNGNAVDAPGAMPYLERFIHGEIYRHRPDVSGIVHSHAASVLPFSIVDGVGLCPVCHMSGFIKSGTPVFEIRRCTGAASDLLIRSQELGRHLAVCLGGHALVLMRGHGMTVVGVTVRQAVFRAVYAEANARIQAAAMALGPVTSLTDEEADAADAANNGQIDRAWDFWGLSAGHAVAALRAPLATSGSGA